MTSVADDEKLTNALLQLEQAERDLQNEKNFSAEKACAMCINLLLLLALLISNRLRVSRIK